MVIALIVIRSTNLPPAPERGVVGLQNCLLGLAEGSSPPLKIAEQPTVRVGNIASGLGTVVIKPDKVYETYPEEKPRRFDIKFTAKGPMWDSQIHITFPIGP